MKKIFKLLLIIVLVFTLTACGDSNTNSSTGSKEETILLAAAASLENAFSDELIPLFEEENEGIKVKATYDSSGKLQAQIEEGADVDVFMSAAKKQMNSLKEEELIKKDSIVELLENKIVLIVPENNNEEFEEFEDITNASIIAIGDPKSVPAGQYAKEALGNLSIWDQANEKLSVGTNVTEVLNWVAEGSADAGIVYQTDAKSNENVKIISQAPRDSVSKVIYPLAIVEKSDKEDSAQIFIDFLKSKEALEVFEKYGFTPNI